MSDAEVRTLGVPLVTGDIPGFVVMIGPAPSDREAMETIKGYQSRGIFVFLIGGIIDQAKRMGISMGFKVRIVEVGPEIWSVSHVVDLVMRAAMIFGNIQPLDYWGMNTYTLERIHAFVNAYAPVDDLTVARAGGEGMIWTVPLVILCCMRYSQDIEGNSDGDPVEVLLKDKLLLGLGLILAIVILTIIYLI